MDHVSKIAMAAVCSLTALSSCVTAPNSNDDARFIAVDKLEQINRVDERFQSYNVESVEITGGNFWAPYPEPGQTMQEYDTGPHGAGFATNAYRKRDPLDLMGNERLRTLTKALGPAYMRVSGSWANSIYFQDDEQPAGDPPEGFEGVLTREQWRGVIDFADAVDAKILTSFATSAGARKSDGTWNPDQARQLFDFTRSLGGAIHAVELTNEPNVRQITYEAQDYADDHVILQQLIDTVSPSTKLVGPGSTGEAGFKLFANPPEEISTARLLSGLPVPQFDAFSYHFYGAVSERCKSLGERDPALAREVTTSADEALSEGWLARADQAQSLYKAMRDRFAPEAPIWITETAQTACGGDRWSSTFLDSFRYLDQLGRFAQQDVDIVFHNTLAASDYALIDDETWMPRPNYWAALLWRRLMGEKVLNAGPNSSDLHVYAHCLRDNPGGIAILAINLNRREKAKLDVSRNAQRYTLNSDDLMAETVELNGKVLKITAQGGLPPMTGVQVSQGPVTMEPSSITFLAVPESNNPNCT